MHTGILKAETINLSQVEFTKYLQFQVRQVEVSVLKFQ